MSSAFRLAEGKREAWVAAARRLLAAEGVGAVTIKRLAGKLNVTRGGFYHHFNGRTDLLGALLGDWEVRKNNEISALAARESLDLKDVLECWSAGNPESSHLDAMVRMWARSFRPAAAAVERIDRGWIALLTRVVSAKTGDSRECLARSRLAYCLHLGSLVEGTVDDRDFAILSDADPASLHPGG